ncbi:MAG: hypothetical protein ACYTF1_25200 [Planctomycetota bacterium]|jgi:hypothetical protein
MSSSTTLGAKCEHCKQEAGVRHLNLHTNEWDFRCGACGYYWKHKIRRCGKDKIEHLACIVNSPSETFPWKDAETVLQGLIAECRHHGYADDKGWLGRVIEVLETPQSARTLQNSDIIKDLIKRFPHGAWCMKDGQPIVDYVEGVGEERFSVDDPREDNTGESQDMNEQQDRKDVSICRTGVSTD